MRKEKEGEIENEIEIELELELEIERESVYTRGRVREGFLNFDFSERKKKGEKPEEGKSVGMQEDLGDSPISDWEFCGTTNGPLCGIMVG